MAAWGRYDDPLFTPYNIPKMSGEQQEAFWRYWVLRPKTIALAGEADGRFIAHILLRDHDPAAGSADLGISMDAALVGQGLGTKLLQRLRTYAQTEHGIRLITLDVAGYNLRAIGAYKRAGFIEDARRFVSFDTSIDFAALLENAHYDWLRPFVRRSETIGGGYMIELVRMYAEQDS